MFIILLKTLTNNDVYINFNKIKIIEYRFVMYLYNCLAAYIDVLALWVYENFNKKKLSNTMCIKT